MKNSVRDIYKDLYSYFGLRSIDGYLNSTSNTTTPTNDGKGSGSLSDAYHKIFGDEQKNASIKEICESIKAVNDNENIFCVTPYDDTVIARNDPKIPLNQSGKDQGLVREDFAGIFTVKGIDGNKFRDTTSDSGRVDVIQVFPVKGVPELADTDVLTLYLSTINSVNMSMAIPYVDVSVATSVGPSISSSSFSFGKFLGSNENDKDTSGMFVNQVGVAGTTTVASMEIFTSPQTLVNSSNTQYNENTAAGGPRDIFRPFMSIENISFSVVPASAGLISFKSSNMKIRLFDRGRLSDIAPIVAPSKFGVVKFEIEYGWSHPAGKMTARTSDADADRIGQLIDSMRVKETYQVVNSNFNFEPDGSVSIDLKLSMLGNSSFTSENISLGPGEEDLANIHSLLQEVKRLTSNMPKGINVPVVLTGDADSFVSINPEQIKELKSLFNSLNGKNGKQTGHKALAKVLGDLIQPSKGQTSKLTTFQKTRKQFVSNFIATLHKNPDPFMRYKGLPADANKNGVTIEDVHSGNYISLGTLLVSMLGPSLQKHGDVIFVFGCFNNSAGAMFDHNISQFPIKLEAKDKELTLTKVLEKELTKRGKITPQHFMEIINEEFVLRQSSEAYGLNQLYETPQVSTKEEETKDKIKIKGDLSKPGTQLAVEQKKIANLKQIYGDTRLRPTFTLPRLNLKVDTKPGNDGKPVIRIIITDQSASNVADIQQIFDDISSQGFFLKEDYSLYTKDANVRGAQHGVAANEVFQEIKDLHLIGPYEPKVGGGSLEDELDKLVGTDTKLSQNDPKLKDELERVFFMKSSKTGDIQLRNVFYKHFPTIIFGSMGSGVISAQLQSNQNDALTTISLQRQGSPEAENSSPNMPMLIHPTQLSMEVFGSPLFKFTQKFFVDFGTGTSADNFYAVTGVDMNFGPGEFKCNLKMTQLDAFGRFMKLRDTVITNLISILIKK